MAIPEPGDEQPRGSDDGTRTRSSSLSSISASPSIPPSGATTPAIFRPLLRRRSSSHASRRHTVSEQTVPQLQSSLRKAQGWLNGRTTFSPRVRTTSDVGYQLQYEIKATEATLHDATQMPRPAHPPRRISHEVHEREKSLRNELDRLRHQVKDQEERKQEEMRTVEFAINRIAETQMNHMKVQQVLLEKVAALDLQAKEAKEELRRAKQEAKRGEGRCEMGEDCCQAGGQGEGGVE